MIVAGDARHIFKMLPDESVDLILTDPPYPKEFLSCYELLGREGGRILRDGGYMFVYGATQYIMEQLDYLDWNDDLTYFWTDAILHVGAYPRLWHKQIMSGYKPVYIFTKGEPRIKNWRASVWRGGRDKRYHEWGQGMSYAVQVIEMLTEVGDLVLDPFAGGGNVLEAAYQTKRRYLGIEIDPAQALKIGRRLKDSQPPLMALDPQQGAMPIDIG